MSLATRVYLSLSAQLQNALDLVTASAPLSQQFAIDLATGIGASQADKVWSDTRTLATGATEDLDLQGALVDALGAAFTPVKLKALLIYARPTNTTNLTILGDANSVPILSAAATTLVLPPGGLFLYVNPSLAGIAVGAGATDIIQVANAAGADAVYDIVIIGTSA